ncbi:ABC transporter substrate-binding protein [Desulfovibrio sp. JC022]|uniref:substrate-binding periplasmic protein n=1 Tax=Desulfovibrio sp. JC022 TaxID=2593642 RepID=UPI0013D42792|nr:transporter substrate-binding domain-containing protein [Desulfovibrio sp. JC022]NDV23409.1 amino acid ABC transporter substrate-binding protein [Desulfovibrio sp. JC022]
MKYITIWFVFVFSIITPYFAKDCAAETYRVMRYIESFPPYYFPKSSFQSGIVKDIFAALSKETGDTFEFVSLPYKRALYQFVTGKIDIEPMANPAWRSHSSVPGIYSIPFGVSEQIVLYNAKYAQPAYLPEDFAGETVGTVAGYTYPVFGVYFADGRIKEHQLKSENKLIQMLIADRLHQAIMNKDFALYRIKTEQLKDQLVVSKPCNSVPMMIRVHPSRKDALPKFNKAIKKLLEDGTISKIYGQYR